MKAANRIEENTREKEENRMFKRSGEFRSLLKAIRAAEKMYMQSLKDAKEKDDQDKNTYCKGAIDALNWLIMDLGYDRRIR